MAARSLFVRDAHGIERLFCDLSVYTKNRVFRVYNSSKWGKGVFLRPSRCCVFPYQSQRGLLFASFICLPSYSLSPPQSHSAGAEISRFVSVISQPRPFGRPAR